MTIQKKFLSFALAATILSVGSAFGPESNGQDRKPRGDEFYVIESIPTPEGVVLEAGGIEVMKDGRLAVSSRRGDIYLFSDPLQKDASKITNKLFMEGLHEVLGLTEKDGWLYATQRCEISRLKDENNDGLADIVETVSDGWEINGDYHEYAFGSKFDKNGDIWVVLCLTGSFSSNVPYRGWCLRVNKDGTTTPTCSGIRSPGGIGSNVDGEIFYTDNQGPWNGTCSLKWLRKGSFQGHPGGNDWYKLTDAIGPRPVDPKSGSRIMTEAKKIPEYEPPAILFPYKKMGQSASGIVCDTSGGKFGPFKNQMFVGDQTFSWVMRVDLQKVKGHYQGACFPFLEGFDSGTLALEQASNGMLFVGGTNRGWGSRGTKPFSLERVRWTGKTPFEVLNMKARHDGFELTFTEPVDRETAGDVASYKMPTYTYIYQSNYGSPEVDHVDANVTKAVVSDDGLSVRLTVDKLHEGHVHELHLDGVKAKDGRDLRNAVGYYTLNYIPAVMEK